MSKTEEAPPSVTNFEVQIESGGRAWDERVAPRTAPNLSPARSAAKAQSRRRTLISIWAVSALLVGIGLWAWLSNPNTNVPSDALARVNGEYIYERDVNRELDLSRMTRDLARSTNLVVTTTAELSQGAVLEDLIDKKMRVQGAHHAGFTMSAAENQAEFDGVLKRTGWTKAQVEGALDKHNLTLDDMMLSLSDSQLITKYISNYVLRGATTDEAKQNKYNDWQTSMAQSSKVDRLKPAGSGPAPVPGSEAPDFTMQNLQGKDVKLSSLRGRPVMINFWATWCPPCRSEIPTIAQMYNDTHHDGLYEIVGVATQSDRSTIEAFSKEFGMNFPLISDADGKATTLYHVLPIPTTFFIDKDGIVRNIQTGPVDRPLMEKWLLGR